MQKIYTAFAVLSVATISLSVFALVPKTPVLYASVSPASTPAVTTAESPAPLLAPAPAAAPHPPKVQPGQPKQPAQSAQPVPQVQIEYSGPDSPARLSIPSIGLSDAVVPVGLTMGGEMDVPSGASTNVGWYKGGIVPGELGSAVLDAHVFAAFAKLGKLKAGDSIYVTMKSGKRLHFVVSAARLYALSDLTSDMLFNQNDARRLNLITCAGNLTADHSTYDHRLVIYATLAE